MRLQAIQRDVPTGMAVPRQAGGRVPVTILPTERCVNVGEGEVQVIAFDKATWAPTGAEGVPLVIKIDTRCTALKPLVASWSLATVGNVAASSSDGAPTHWANLATTDQYVREVQSGSRN